MSTLRRTRLRVIWSTLSEPRWVTFAYVAMYLIGLITAIAILTVDPPKVSLAETITLSVACLMLGAGAIVGLPAAWSGRWWAESFAAAASAGGWLLAAVDLMVLQFHPELPQLMRPVLSIAGTLGFSVALLARFARVRTRPHAPGVGGETVSERCDRVRCEGAATF